jgi:DNA primase
MTTVDGRARLAELARPLVNKIPTGVYRELLVESLAEAVGLTAAKLEKMLGSDMASGRGVGHAPGKRAARARPAAGQPSIVQHAVSLVVNHPGAALKADAEKLAGVNRKGTDLLIALIETVQAEPNISTAGLVERFRHDEQGRYLGRLAASELPVDEEFDAAAELADCLEQLARAGRKERVEFLIEKQRVNGLSEDEKNELRQLY